MRAHFGLAFAAAFIVVGLVRLSFPFASWLDVFVMALVLGLPVSFLLALGQLIGEHRGRQ
jgi:lauroyl/myristoyl acyltransferase